MKITIHTNPIKTPLHILAKYHDRHAKLIGIIGALTMDFTSLYFSRNMITTGEFNTLTRRTNEMLKSFQHTMDDNWYVFAQMLDALLVNTLGEVFEDTSIDSSFLVEVLQDCTSKIVANDTAYVSGIKLTEITDDNINFRVICEYSITKIETITGLSNKNIRTQSKLFAIELFNNPVNITNYKPISDSDMDITTNIAAPYNSVALDLDKRVIAGRRNAYIYLMNQVVLDGILECESDGWYHFGTIENVIVCSVDEVFGMYINVITEDMLTPLKQIFLDSVNLYNIIAANLFLSDELKKIITENINEYPKEDRVALIKVAHYTGHELYTLSEDNIAFLTNDGEDVACDGYLLPLTVFTSSIVNP